MKRFTVFSIPIVLVTLFVAGYLLKQAPQVPDTMSIPIGAAIALTGDGASWGEMSLKGAEMAVDEINSGGGIKGKKLRLVVEDTQSTSIGSTSAVQKLINADSVSAVLGPTWLDVYQGAQGVASDKDIPIISVDAGVEAVNSPKTYPNVFSLWYRSQPKAELLIRHLASIGVRRLAVVHQNDSYYEDFGNRMETEAKKMDITIIERERVNGGEGDFKTLLTKLKQEKPDMIFAAFYDPFSIDAFFRHRAQLYPNLPLVTDDLGGPEYINRSEYTSYIQNMRFFTAMLHDPSFEKRFEMIYPGVQPKFGASNGYDAIMILADALRQQSRTITEHLKNSEFNTITFGTMRFDELNGVETENQVFVMKQFLNGEVSYLK